MATWTISLLLPDKQYTEWCHSHCEGSQTLPWDDAPGKLPLSSGASRHAPNVAQQVAMVGRHARVGKANSPQSRLVAAILSGAEEAVVRRGEALWGSAVARRPP